MATLSELRDAVNSLLDLPGIASVLQLNSPTRERAFEAYVFSLFVRAVRQIGSNSSAVLKGISSGPAPRIIVLRGGPGPTWFQSSGFCIRGL